MVLVTCEGQSAQFTGAISDNYHYVDTFICHHYRDEVPSFGVQIQSGCYQYRLCTIAVPRLDLHTVYIYEVTCFSVVVADEKMKVLLE